MPIPDDVTSWLGKLLAYAAPGGLLGLAAATDPGRSPAPLARVAVGAAVAGRPGGDCDP